MPTDSRQQLPSIDRLLQTQASQDLIRRWGRPLVLRECRTRLRHWRSTLDPSDPVPSTETVLDEVTHALSQLRAGPRRVLNLTGTVIHTNLGRAPLPSAVIDALQAALGATDLELDLGSGKRGERDHHVEGLLCELTGAEAATVVNNNAAAVMLVLNTFAAGREVPVSRGELVEIGGAFRMPDIMAGAGARLVEVGTTNRTHLDDYARALGPETGMLMKVHPSNYAIQGFHSEVTIAELAGLARQHQLPLAWDLGSGSLVDLARFGLPREPMPQDALAAGADLVTFSGDKLLGGPQCGIIVGDRDAVDAVRRNPLKRALRLDKLMLAALAAVLRLYGDAGTLAQQLPALARLTRPPADIQAQAERLQPRMAAALSPRWQVSCCSLNSQIGSGALPVDLLPSAGLRLTPVDDQGAGQALEQLHASLRHLPTPVVGRIQQGALLLDLRCLDNDADEQLLCAQLNALEPS